MEARARVGEHVRDEAPLADLEALLVLLEQLPLLVDRSAARELLRELLGRRIDELRDAQLLAIPVGEVVVDRVHVAAQVLVPRGVGWSGRDTR